MRKHRLERWLDRQRARCVERLKRQAEFSGEIKFRGESAKAPFAAVDFEPPGLSQEWVASASPINASCSATARENSGRINRAVSANRSRRDAARNASSQGMTDGKNDK